MRPASILLLCILGAVLLLATVDCSNSNNPSKCCFSWYPRRIKKDLITSYHMTSDRCARFAIVFVTVKGRHVCVNPNLSWVESIMKNLDENSF